MRIITWNCNGALRNKFLAISDTIADVLIVQECENPSTSDHSAYREWAKDSYLWVGNIGTKGLGVFPRKDNAIAAIPGPPCPAQHFLPFLLRNAPVCAVWAHRDPVGSQDYIGQVWNFIQSGPSWLNDPRCVLAGDFNSNPIWDRKRRPWNHSAVVDALAGHGLRSAYHDVYPEKQGQEAQPTFFMQRNLLKPYHIDYAFVGKGWDVKAAIVGKADNWLAWSDHVPLTVDLSNRVL